MIAKTLRSAAAGLVLVAGLVGLTGPALAAGKGVPPINVAFSFDGPFGTYDQAELQRGFQVYREVCSACHGLYHIDYRHLDGIGLSEDEIRALASSYLIVDGPDENGDMFERPGLPSDDYWVPFANEQAARASNGGAYPVDLSLVVKARGGGADYVYSFLVGYDDSPEHEVSAGRYYNEYYPGHEVAMPNVLFDGVVTYQDGTDATVDQVAHDVTAFLTWAAEPTMERRKQLGLQVMLFLLIFAGIMYAVKRKIWADQH